MNNLNSMDDVSNSNPTVSNIKNKKKKGEETSTASRTVQLIHTLKRACKENSNTSRRHNTFELKKPN